MSETTTTAPAVLKGGEFLVKDVKPEDIFVPEDSNEEQQMMRQMTRDFIDNEVTPNVEKLDNHEPGLMISLLNKAGEIGLLGTSIPEEYGGFGRDFVTGTLITEEVGAGHSFAVALAAHTGIGTLPIYYYGTEEQRKRYLPKLVTGELKGAYCLTEPGSGSDALAAKTTAVLSPDKKFYVLNGQKMWITNGGFADIFTVFAKIDGEKFTGFIVEANTPGVTRGHEENKMGIKGSSTCQIFFQDAKIPVENVLGEIGKGHLIAFNILNIGRQKLCAAALGGAKRAATMSIQYATQREQFKKPIASFGAIQYKLAEQAIRIYATESALYRVSQDIEFKKKQLVESGKSNSQALMGAAEEYAIECSILKVFGSEVLNYVVDENVQIFGGVGFSEEYPAARSYRDSRINRIFEGTNEINRLLTVDMLLKRTMKGALDLMTPALAIQKELMGIPEIGSDNGGEFTEEKKAVANMKKAVLMVAGAAVQKLMMQLTDEQEILMDVSDMIMETYVSESLLLRVEKLADKGADEIALKKDILQTFINDSIDRLNVKGKNAIASFAEGDELRMLLVGLKRFTKYGPVNTKAARRRIAAKLIADNKYSF
jgi:hypothetical protein